MKEVSVEYYITYKNNVSDFITEDSQEFFRELLDTPTKNIKQAFYKQWVQNDQGEIIEGEVGLYDVQKEKAELKLNQ